MTGTRAEHLTTFCRCANAYLTGGLIKPNMKPTEKLMIAMGASKSIAVHEVCSHLWVRARWQKRGNSNT